MYFSDKVIYFIKDNDKAKTPIRALGSVGFDLFSTETKLLLPGKTTAVETGIKVLLPGGTYGRIASRSGIALRSGVFVEAGVIDPSYRGTLKVVLFNSSSETFLITEAERIAQLICEKCAEPRIEVVEKFPHSEDTERNDLGFGSTGFY